LPKKNLKRLKIHKPEDNVPKISKKRKPSSKSKKKGSNAPRKNDKSGKTGAAPKVRSVQNYDDVDIKALGCLKKQ